MDKRKARCVNVSYLAAPPPASFATYRNCVKPFLLLASRYQSPFSCQDLSGHARPFRASTKGQTKAYTKQSTSTQYTITSLTNVRQVRPRLFPHRLRLVQRTHPPPPPPIKTAQSTFCSNVFPCRRSSTRPLTLRRLNFLSSPKGLSSSLTCSSVSESGRFITMRTLLSSFLGATAVAPCHRPHAHLHFRRFVYFL